MSVRLPTSLWVDALIRRAQLGGAPAFIVQKGDGERGDVLLKVARLDGTARVYAPAMDMDGDRIFIDLILQGVGPLEADIDEYVGRARRRDTDLWVVEVEDREGRHFLTETVKVD
ncbi:MAG: DUF1491 family protein [Pseudomonadota bacterium]